MADAKSICNLGLSKIAASRITSLNPAKTPIERHCADGYPVWRDNELEKRDWRFALVEGYALTQSGPVLTDAKDGRRYKYALPNDWLRPLRNKRTEWSQRGTFLYSAYPNLCIDYIKRTVEGDFTSTFVDLLACRVAMESVEFATQSNTKGQSADMKYAEALKLAGHLNAYVTGPQDITLDEENSSWIQARYGNVW